MSNFIILVGPSASGKSTIEKKLGLKNLVLHTSRKPREGEVDGVDYHFVDKSFFDKKDEFIYINRISSDLIYGISKKEVDKVLETGEDIIYSTIDILPAVELQFYIKEKNKVDINFIFIGFDMPHKKRKELLLKRGALSQEELNIRLHNGVEDARMCKNIVSCYDTVEEDITEILKKEGVVF